ncbi:Fe-S cluster assembly protein SufD [Leptolyngbya sp. 'hensonii']|uniref:Fe-S cluster assembly protein SufD n=1 Tax=Leptolyngbya sp. 'hensonii' TaxID=1922337 RepID=UPI0009501D8C|nr:Fe-S cluster assembly protein SufD [Leptolyngbya sp. 'hensonii']OLP19039.1 Fe-S cluster assembly protein SufD [Leptolyngbya sp. 'hensonii']
MTIQVVPEPALQANGFVDRQAYLAALLQERREFDHQGFAPATIAALQQLRQSAATQIQDLAIPSSREEAWRFTDLSSLLQISFTTPTTPRLESLPATQNPCRLVFVNGNYAAHLSTVPDLPAGLFVGNLATAGALQARVVEHLGQQPGRGEVFTALNTASFTDVAIVWIPKAQTVSFPIELLFLSISAPAPTLTHPRCFVVAEAGSQVTIVEDYRSFGPAPALTNPVTELWVGAMARVNHTRLQREGTTSFHIGKTVVTQERDSHFTGTAVSLGAHLSRHNLEIYQTGEQTETILNGLTLISGEQVADTHSEIIYSKPQGRSRQVHKCIVGDRAHAIFNGRVFVPKAAQLTDAGQVSRTLLLSPKARVDTKPQLEIVADNVKCAHGAAVSQLEAGEVFYLLSRGIDQPTAQKLLIYGFASEVIQQIPVATLQAELSQFVRDHSS